VNKAETIAVVGAGYTGTMLAVQLLRRGDARVLLFERTGTFGPGLAHGTPCPAHLLNVRTDRMSAFPDDAGHFARWLATAHPTYTDPNGFAPRRLYGEYLRWILDEAMAAAPGRLERIAGEVTAVRAEAGDTSVTLADGRRFEADRVVLAFGNPPPDAPGPRGLGGAPADRYLADPWAPGALAAVRPSDEVLLIGTGLTMIDVVLALDTQGWIGRALALSRRGLLPRPHDAAQLPAEAWPTPDVSLSHRIKAVRARAREVTWGRALDEIRPFNQALWRGAELGERSRFLRHLRPWWDVHRHRTAFEVGAKIEAFRARGSLDIAGGRIVDAEPYAGGVWVDWRPRGETQARRGRFDRVVNCTGPLSDLSKSSEPLLKDLFARGLVRTDALRLGLDVDPQWRVIDAEGQPNPRLYAAGPITKGECWEIVAVPEIRGQVAAMAERFAQAKATA
jgi:uncharacterized NAD(P)/FAD-binding protein YdhS